MLKYKEDEYQNQTSYLVYSKTVKDNLPITKTIISARPCIDPSMTSSSSAFNPLEKDRGMKCMHTNGTYLYDPRFTLVGDSITEFDLFEEYGIIQKLQQITYHERYLDYG